jgi:hypothetical protein
LRTSISRLIYQKALSASPPIPFDAAKGSATISRNEEHHESGSYPTQLWVGWGAWNCRRRRGRSRPRIDIQAPRPSRAQSVTLVTAMGEGADGLDWRSLAASGQTVVFYMGISQLPRIVGHLLSHGAPGSRPAAIIERATLPDQRIVAGTLDNISARAEQAGIEAPALLILGGIAARAAGAKLPMAVTGIGSA